jgi:hypothetical protein
MENGEDTSPRTARSHGGVSCAEGDKEARTSPAIGSQKRRVLANQEAKELPSESEEMEPRVSNSTSNHHRNVFGS